MDSNELAVLNVAGPRESNRPGIYAKTAALLRRLLPRVFPGPGSAPQ
ncbi:MAG: YpsA SLOG family protein [Planctomycetota bacterium]